MEYGYQIWTDWIQAGSAFVGVPAAIAGFIILFLKDKDKESQLRELKNISRRQSEIAEEMGKQLAEFKAQTQLMKDANAIRERHVDFLREMVIQDTGHKEKERLLRQEEERERIKPFFAYNGGGKQHPNYTLRLKNVGETGRIESITAIQREDIRFENLSEKTRTVAKDGEINLHFIFQGDKSNYTYPTFQAEFVVSDLKGNRYTQIIDSKQGMYSLGSPILNKD